MSRRLAIVIPLAAASMLAACTRASKEEPRVVPELGRDAGASRDPVADAGGHVIADAAAPDSPFDLVVRGAKLDLFRILDGPVVASQGDTRALYALAPTGEVTPLGALATLTAETTTPWLEMGRVVGVRDHVFLERATFAGRGGVFIENYSADLARGTAARTTRFGHVSSAFLWKNGSIIAFDAEDSSVMVAWMARKGRFFVVSGQPGPLPRLPEEAASARGDFVGYPSGRIFAHAGKKSKVEGEAPDTTFLWDFVDGLRAQPVKMPGEVRGLVQGREEKETLAFGSDWLARFDGSSWAKLPDAPVDVTSASVGDDGSMWVVAGGALWSAETVSAPLTKVPLPASVTPASVVARSRTDVWLASFDDGGSLRHLGGQRMTSLQSIAENRDDFVRRALGEKEPAPYTGRCAIPFVVFGGEGDVADADALAAVEKQTSLATSTPIVGRTKAGTFVGVEILVTSYDPALAGQLTATVRALKPKFPGARLLCTKPTVVREITAKK
ncbi:MAG: hypothetical protein JST00_02180 [Deltaproteobacteria bacterium]|nr:hypothetical protein [Deltaproteobacteria bacterium]